MGRSGGRWMLSVGSKSRMGDCRPRRHQGETESLPVSSPADGVAGSYWVVAHYSAGKGIQPR
jgi:hypothetical protein